MTNKYSAIQKFEVGMSFKINEYLNLARYYIYSFGTFKVILHPF